MIKRKPLKLNENSYLHKKIRNEIKIIEDKLSKLTCNNFNCKNINDNLYGFLIFGSNYSYIITTSEGYYIIDTIGSYRNLTPEIESLIKVVHDDINFLSYEVL